MKNYIKAEDVNSEIPQDERAIPLIKTLKNDVDGVYNHALDLYDNGFMLAETLRNIYNAVDILDTAVIELKRQQAMK